MESNIAIILIYYKVVHVFFSSTKEKDKGGGGRVLRQGGVGHILEQFMVPCSSHLCLRGGNGLVTPVQ